MTEEFLWVYEGTGLEWLHDRLGRPDSGGPGHVVSELVPGGFEAYVRIFHRFEAGDGSGRTRTWSSLAAESRTAFHPELMSRALTGRLDAVGELLWEVYDGVLDPHSRAALAGLLTEVTGDQAVYFAYDLPALIHGATSPLVHRSSLAALEEVRRSVADVVGDSGPEFWWPEDRSWVVTTDFDLLSTYVGCSARTAELLHADGALETIAVTPSTRVDNAAEQYPSR
ncbi:MULTISPECIES: hypothetical protein [unclassified Streptomyces]|uniref:hypothetical protein n=1 Tax=unclassified Streptomyces TaxID=2593676 RepID=UPI000DC469E8|nr:MULTISPECIES: hypothetical protein [unclassified Streptomyces]MYT73443.1 hypothetical protein [Streptomyces sp. SID8367]RAJ84971.1 hypothetical protein K377_03452 [Streptomyces sp. PsTaAH-137]